MSHRGTDDLSDLNNLFKDLVEMIGEMNSGWEMEFDSRIGPETFLGEDLGFKSLDLVRLAIAIQKRYNHKKIPFQELFVSDDGRIRKDLQVSCLADFLYDHVAGASTNF